MKTNVSEDGKKADKENKWNCLSSAESEDDDINYKVNSIQWEIKVSKSIAIPLPSPPLPPGKKKEKKSLTVKKRELQLKKEGVLSARDLELDTFKRQEPCLLYSWVYTLCLVSMRVSTQKTFAEWMNGMWQGVNKRLIKWRPSCRECPTKAG